jgi:D-threo-aldose 1-dehydrogenase
MSPHRQRLETLLGHIVVERRRRQPEREAAVDAAAGPASASSAADLVLRPRQLAPSDIILGGGNSSIAHIPQDEATAVVHACLNSGIRDFDSAPLYGAGQSELKLGRALVASGAEALMYAGQPIRLHTKTGRLVRAQRQQHASASDGGLGWRPCSAEQPWPSEPGGVITDDYSANGAFLSHHESRQRLQGLRIDTLRIHDADTNGGVGTTQATGALDQALLPQGMLAGLRALRADGDIRHVSLGMNAHPGIGLDGNGGWTPDVITAFIEAAPPGTFDSALLAYGWSLLAQDGLEVLLCCQRAGISVHLAGVFGGSTFEPLFNPKPAHKQTVARWQALADEYDVSLGAVAITFGALPACVEKIVVGMNKVSDVELTVAQLGERVPMSLWRDAQARGLLPSRLSLKDA